MSFSVVRFSKYFYNVSGSTLVQHVKNFRIFLGDPLVNIKFLWAFNFFSTPVPKVEMRWVQNLQLGRSEVFIAAKIHPMHIRHYDTEAYGGGVGYGGIASLKFNIDPRKGYVATMSQRRTLKEKTQIIP